MTKVKEIKLMPISDLIESFFHKRLIAQQRASPQTINSYRDSIRLLILFASEQTKKRPSLLSTKDLDRELILSFLDHLEKERGNSIRTRNARLVAIRAFFHHVAYSDPAAMGVAQRVLTIPGKRTSRRVIGFLRAEELGPILKSPNTNTVNGRRDYTLLHLLARTGARVSEAIEIRPADLRFEKPWQVLLRGKGSKERIVPLAKDMAVLLKTLCHERGLTPDSQAPLFVNSRGHSLSRHGVIYILDRAVEEATKQNPELAKKSISPHVLRHTTAMNLLRSGVDLSTIKSWFGHENLNTTHQYVEADIEMKRLALEKCDVPAAGMTTYRGKDNLLTMLENLQEYVMKS